MAARVLGIRAGKRGAGGKKERNLADWQACASRPAQPGGGFFLPLEAKEQIHSPPDISFQRVAQEEKNRWCDTMGVSQDSVVALVTSLAVPIVFCLQQLIFWVDCAPVMNSFIVVAADVITSVDKGRPLV